MTNSYALSDSVEAYQDGGTTKSRIKPFGALAELYGSSLPVGRIGDILDELEQHVTRVAAAKKIPTPSASAFANTRGQWHEILVAATAWNFRIKRKFSDLVIVKMPNVRTFDFRNVFDDNTRDLLQHLEQSLRRSKVRLITSNPDVLIVRQRGLVETEHNQLIRNLSQDNIDSLNSLYLTLQHKCIWNSVKAGVGLKTSLRPDRRLQLVHEANVLKSVFAHLKMRHWDASAAFRYYGASSDAITSADDDALTNAATHTILFVDSRPEPAVDGVFPLSSVADIEKMFEDILTDLNS